MSPFIDTRERPSSGAQHSAHLPCTASPALVPQFERLVWSVVRRSGLAHADAEDAVQQTWLRLYECADGIRDSRCLPGWLATTAARECQTLQRRRTREVVLDVVPERAADEPDLLSGLERRELEIAVRQAAALLPERERRLVQCLLRKEPMSYAELGAELDMPHGSIGPVRARALRHLAVLLAERGWL